MTTRTLNAVDAARLLHIHPQTLMSLARARVVPGCKVGRAWVFVESLLIEYLVAQSQTRVSVADAQEKSEYRYTVEKIRPTIGSNSRPSEASQLRYRLALGLPTGARPRSSTTGCRPNVGSVRSSASSSVVPGKMPWSSFLRKPTTSAPMPATSRSCDGSMLILATSTSMKSTVPWWTTSMRRGRSWRRKARPIATWRSSAPCGAKRATNGNGSSACPKFLSTGKRKVVSVR